MPVHFDAIKWYAQFGGTASAWMEITDDVIRSSNFPTYNYGISGTGVNDRVADTGVMSFQLDNSARNSRHVVGYYSQNNSNKRTGFNAGLPVKMTVTYDDIEKVKFTGYIPPTGITPSPFLLGERKTNITVLDFMEQTAIHDIDLPAYATDKTFSQLAALVFANMPIQPTATSYGVCESTLPYLFDNLAGGKTKAMTELQKGALSEFGYCYQLGDGTFVTEGRNTRTDKTATTKISKTKDDSGRLLLETGDYLLKEDGDKIILDEAIDIDISDYIRNPVVTVGENLATIVSANGYPRKIDGSSDTVLFTLQKAIKIEAGGTLASYRGRYSDPTGVYKSVNGIDMQTPIATTDYLAFANEDGTGTNYTANLTVTASYGTGEVDYTLVNGAGVDIWVTKLQARGKGVYWDNPFSYLAYDSTARAIYGSYRIDIDMKYQDDPTTVQQIVDIMLARLKEPRTSLTSVSFFANRNMVTAGAYFYLDIGVRQRLTEPVNAIDEDYFIQGIRAVVYPGDIIEVTWTVKPALYDSYEPAIWDEDVWDGMKAWGA